MLGHRINPEYLNAAMQRAIFEELPEGEGVVGTIPGFQGVWANGPTVDEARTELAEVLEDWVDLGMRFGDPLPEIDGIALSQS